MSEISKSPQSDPQVPNVWIKLAVTGQFRGHSSGPFEITHETLDQIVRNFDRNKLPVPIDAEHASEADPTSGSIPSDGAPAMGWIHQLEARSDGLWACVEWLEPARSYIKEGRYRYISPAIRFGSRDKVTGQNIGARLTSAGLTNTPFLTLPRLIAAKDGSLESDPEATQLSSAMCYSTHEFMPAIKAALRMHELSTPMECSDMLGKLRDYLDAADGDHTAKIQGLSLGDYLMPMRELTKAPMGTTWDQVLDTVQDMIDVAIDEHELEYHQGEAEPDDDVESTDLTDRGSAAPPEQEMDTISLKDHETKVAALTLQLKDAESKNTELTAENKKLKDAEEARVERDHTARVAEAFDTYKDQKQLNEDNRKQMSLTLKSDPELFEKLYPRVLAGQRHLARRVVDPRGNDAPQGHDGIPTIKTLTDKYVKEGLDIGTATSRAFVEVRAFHARH